MATDYFSDYQAYVSRSMPSPADTPSDTPPLPRSRRSSRRGTPRDPSSSPPPVPAAAVDNTRRSEGNLFGMDPKRFTPTLHASLVSEILTLRRELDSKHQFIDDLESTLEAERNRNENLAGQLSQNAKEFRLAEQRFKTLENGTLDAVEDLVRERDDAKTASSELKAKLDTLNRRARQQEENAVQSQQSWETEKLAWDNERRQLERRVHVTESRLRSFIEQISVHQADMEEQELDNESGPEESTFKDSGLGNDSDAGSLRSCRTIKHRRNQSSVSFRSIPLSLGSPRKNAAFTNLADELGFDEEDEYDLEYSDHDDEELLADKRLGRTSSVRSSAQSARSDSKAKKLLGLSDDTSSTGRTTPTSYRDSTVAKTPTSGSIPEVAVQLGLQLARPHLTYVDHGVQPSRPASPVNITPSTTNDIPLAEPGAKHNFDKWQPDADKPRSTAHVGVQVDEPTQSSLAIQHHPSHAPLSPPETPVVQTTPLGQDYDDSPTTIRSPPKSTYESSSTQTDLPAPHTENSGFTQRRGITVEALPIPSIAIHRPVSAPTSPGTPLLPPGMADASVQTDTVTKPVTCDVAVQTEEIRIDKRPVKLPPHLLSNSFSHSNQEHISETPAMGAPEVKARRGSVDARPRRNSEKLPLKAISLPRPILLAAAREEERQREKTPMSLGTVHGEDSGSGKDLAALLGSHVDWQEPSNSADDHASETDQKDLFGTTPGLARHTTRSTFSGPPKTVPEDREISPAHFPFSSASFVHPGNSSPRRDSDASSIGTRPRSSKAPGSSSHSRSSRAGSRNRFHSRTPSTTSMGSSSISTGNQGGTVALPPFPIPLRSSSRVRGMAASDSGSSPVRHDSRTVGSRRSDRDLPRKGSVRKAQSSNSIKSSVRTSPRRRRRGQQLTPIQSMAFDSPPDFDQPDTFVTQIGEHGPFSPVTEDNATEGRDDTAPNEYAVDDNNQDTSVVDAIAATMVGEWMWKYVRRRRSFGVGDTTPGDDGMNGARHKRWVWLSPYERTIMWSSKQPNSGSALLGKNGRKLNIKSVLDVKDDAAPPKLASGETAFDRSILILAPERALKLTAPNKERHHLWLTALSFLAQSGHGPPQVPRLPVKPAEPPIRRQLQPPFGDRNDVMRDTRHNEQTLHRGVTDTVLGPGGSLRHDASTSNPRPPSANGSLYGAEPPNIPRVAPYRHQRKRSSTNPALPPPSISSGLRSFSSNAISSTMTSALARTATNTTAHKPSHGDSSYPASRRTSIASPEQPNFFEAVGTVRMEAFVDPNYHDGVLYVPAPPVLPKRSDRRHGTSIRSSTTEDRRRAGYVFDENENDPFTGF